MLTFRRLLWWTAKKMFRTRTCGCWEFVDMRRSGRDNTETVADELSSAFARITMAGHEFVAVATEVRFVAAMDGGSRTMPDLRGYAYDFAGMNALNSHALAVRMLWVGMNTRLSREASRLGVQFELSAVRKACLDVQLKFVHTFPDSLAWEKYVRADYEAH